MSMTKTICSYNTIAIVLERRLYCKNASKLNPNEYYKSHSIVYKNPLTAKHKRIKSNFYETTINAVLFYPVRSNMIHISVIIQIDVDTPNEWHLAVTQVSCSCRTTLAGSRIFHKYSSRLTVLKRLFDNNCHCFYEIRGEMFASKKEMR